MGDALFLCLLLGVLFFLDWHLTKREMRAREAARRRGARSQRRLDMLSDYDIDDSLFFRW
jgi:hypothetical protein